MQIHIQYSIVRPNQNISQNASRCQCVLVNLTSAKPQKVTYLKKGIKYSRTKERSKKIKVRLSSLERKSNVTGKTNSKVKNEQKKEKYLETTKIC